MSCIMVLAMAEGKGLNGVFCVMREGRWAGLWWWDCEDCGGVPSTVRGPAVVCGDLAYGAS